MKYYIKIDAIYKRDEKSKKTLIGEYRDSVVETLKDIKWTFTEKVDGTNIIVHWDGNKVEFGGRTERTQIPTHLLQRLNELFSGHEMEELFEQKFGDKDVYIYGEGYGNKIQNSDYIDTVDFIIFDVLINDVWLERPAVEDVAKYFNCNIVPIIFEGTLDEGVEYVKQYNDSKVGTKPTKMEGLVARPCVELKNKMGKRIITKIKYEDLK